MPPVHADCPCEVCVITTFTVAGWQQSPVMIIYITSTQLGPGLLSWIQVTDNIFLRWLLIQLKARLENYSEKSPFKIHVNLQGLNPC